MIYTHFIAAVLGLLASWFLQDVRMDTLKTNQREAVMKLVVAHKTEVRDIKDLHAKEFDRARKQTEADQAAITTQYQGALNEARVRETTLRRDAAAARTESDGLREQAAHAARRIAAADAAPAAVAEYATVAGELLADCSRRHQGLAEAADGHVSDVRTLLGAWPVVPTH